LFNSQMIATNLRLERKIVSRYDTFHSLYDISQKLTRLHLEEIYQSIPEIIGKYFGSEKASFYKFEDRNMLVLKNSIGWKDNHEFEEKFDLIHMLTLNIRFLKEVTVLGPVELEELNIPAYFVVALVSKSDHELFGMIKIEKTSVIDIIPSNIKLLSLLGNWIVEAIENSRKYAESQALARVDAITGLVHEEAFWEDMQRAVTSALRNKYDVVLIFFYLTILDTYEEDDEEEEETETSSWFSDEEDDDRSKEDILYQEIAELLKEQGRSDDGVAIGLPTSPYQFMLLLPFTSMELAEIPLERIHHKMKKVDELYAEKTPFRYEIKAVSLLDGSMFLDPIIHDKIKIG
ncbi:MAG: hypothetical protein ACI86H_002093, partial [bacterium]